MKKLFFLAVILISFSFFGQEVHRFKLKKYKVSILDQNIKETSGLQWFQEKIYTFNDGGNMPEIFKINPENGAVLSQHKMPFRNTDWEAITADETAIYIGDFGNNRGNRMKLKVYRIPMNGEKFDTESITEIPFYYPEQTDFSRQSHRHNFDAESMIYLDGKIHIFTKEWETKNTTHYTISIDENSNQPAQKLEQFDLGYLATDASYYQGKLYIIGYNTMGRVRLTVFQKDENGLFFSRPYQMYRLGGAGKLGQVEGIEVNKKGLYISAEKLNYKGMKEPQSYYFVPWEQFITL